MATTIKAQILVFSWHGRKRQTIVKHSSYWHFYTTLIPMSRTSSQILCYDFHTNRYKYIIQALQAKSTTNKYKCKHIYSLYERRRGVPFNWKANNTKSSRIYCANMVVAAAVYNINAQEFSFMPSMKLKGDQKHTTTICHGVWRISL